MSPSRREEETKPPLLLNGRFWSAIVAVSIATYIVLSLWGEQRRLEWRVEKLEEQVQELRSTPAQGNTNIEDN